MMIDIKDSTKMALPIIFLLLTVGVLLGVVGIFFLIEKGKHNAGLYIGIGYILVGVMYALIVLTAFYYVISLIARVQEREKLERYEEELRRHKE